MSNTYDFARPTSWSPLDVLVSPFYGLAETAGNLPGIRDTGFLDWLYNSPLTQGAQAFREDQPGWALGTDIIASFVPYLGWGAALNRASQGANLGRGLLGLTNRAGVGAASLFPKGPLAFAAGETVRFLPPAAAISTFDVLGERYQNPWDAATGLALGTLLGGAAQAGGHALSPAVRQLFPATASDIQKAIQQGLHPSQAQSVPSAVWSGFFEPGPQLSSMYGFTDRTRRAAAAASKDPRMQAALNPALEPQIIHRALLDIRQGIDDGSVTTVDRDLLEGQIDAVRRATVNEQPEPFQTVLDYEKPLPQSRMQWAMRFGQDEEGRHLRLPLTGSGDNLTNPEFLGRQLSLHPDWLADVKWPGITQVIADRANAWRRLHNLPEFIGDRASNAPLGTEFRRVTRVLPSGLPQAWIARREKNDGLWTLMVEAPGDYKLGRESRKFAGKPARSFFTFKTDRPQRFFPGTPDSPGPFSDLDNAGPDNFWYRRSNLDTTKSPLLKQILDFEDIYLNPQTLKSTFEAMLSSKRNKEKFVESILAGPTFGKEIASLVDRYAAPTIQQFKDQPVAQGIWGLYRATMEGLEGRVRRQLHGLAMLEDNKSPIASLFSPANIDDADALVPALRKAQLEDPETLEIVRKVLKTGDIDIKSVAGRLAGQWLAKLEKVTGGNLEEYNAGIDSLRRIGATDARLIPKRRDHYGVSRSWDGSIFVPIYGKNAIRPEAVAAGGSLAQAKAKAEAWIKAAAAREPDKGFRAGQAYIPGETGDPPGWLERIAGDPRFLQPRGNMRGYEHEFEPYKHIDDFIAELEDNLLRRARYFGRVAADALTAGKRNQIRFTDANTWNILNTRIAQLLGQPLASEEWQNRIADSMLAKTMGTNSMSKIADAANEAMFHMLHGLGYAGTPALNMLNWFQTVLPAGVEMLSSNPNALRGFAYQVPKFDERGLTRPGFDWIADPIGLMWGGWKRATDPTAEEREIFQYLFNQKIMGTGLANEYMGQDRTAATRYSEGIRGPEDMAYWFRRVSSFLMQKSEQVIRTMSAGMSLEAMDRLEKAWGIKFTTAQKIHNAATMVERANYAYFKQDRPMMFNTPLGSIFGNQKTWMTNYLFMMAHYFGLGKEHGNWAPLLFSLGTTTALGGVFAVPLLGAGIDTLTETFADKDGREFIFEQMGEGGNAVSFGLPALFGVSLAGNVAAPGSNLAHDAEFFFSIVALERAKALGRAIGRGIDDQLTLGINPMSDETFRRQTASALAPRSLYRVMESLLDDSLKSVSTGYPMVKEFGLGARILHGLGFRDVDIAVQYEAYRSLLADRTEMRRRISLFGEAYADAMLNNDRQRGTELLQRAVMMGLDINSVMRSAQVRMRNEGRDMFGRNFNQEQLERYHATLSVGGL